VLGQFPGVKKASVSLDNHRNVIKVECEDRDSGEWIKSMVQDKVNGMPVKVDWFEPPYKPSTEQSHAPYSPAPIRDSRNLPEGHDVQAVKAFLGKLPGVTKVKLDDFPMSWERNKFGKWQYVHHDYNAVDEAYTYNVVTKTAKQAVVLDNLLVGSVWPDGTILRDYYINVADKMPGKPPHPED
jgi:copper chaperone CopZ